MRSSDLLAELCGISSDANEFDLMLNYLVFFCFFFFSNNDHVLGMILICSFGGTIDNIFFFLQPECGFEPRPLHLV